MHFYRSDTILMISSQPYSLAQHWAKRYLENASSSQRIVPEGAETVGAELAPSRKSVRAIAAERLLSSLRQVSAKAWSQTEALLRSEIHRQQIDKSLINAWEISQDAFLIYEKALELYTQRTSYSQVPFLMGPDIAKIRKKYTQNDPRIIGFVSMQFHYMSDLLKTQLSPIENSLLGNCFQVIDDHLYMPLHRAYDAAANHDNSDPRLQVVHQLIDCSHEISVNIVERVAELYPNYQTHGGLLSHPSVKVSSLRDTQMFQIYLFVCVLEGNFSIVEQELFPLCLMLYPKLKVHWELVRQMLQLLGSEAYSRLNSDLYPIVEPYLRSFREAFSPEVFMIQD